MASESQQLPASQDMFDRYIPGAFPDPVDNNFTSQQTLTQAVFARRDEYTEPRQIKIKIGSWNVGNHSCSRDIAAWFLHGQGLDTTLSKTSLNLSSKNEQQQPADESIKHQEARQSHLRKTEPTVPKGDHSTLPSDADIGLYVLGLQEVVDVGSPAEAFRPYTEPGPAGKYKDTLEEALPKGYSLVAEQQLVGLLILIYASPSVADDIQSSTTTSVGTGLMGYMGNKGAVTAHFILGEATRIVFVNSHLASGSDKASLERRNWDTEMIIARTRFNKIDDPSGVPQPQEEVIGMEDFAFWFGDLNYRIGVVPGEDVRTLLKRHLDEYDEERTSESSTNHNEGEDDANGGTDKASTKSGTVMGSITSSLSKMGIVNDEPDDLDPSSLQTTISSLLSHDELHQQIKERKAFHHGWKEGPIRFLPTYKYDVGKVAVYDTSEKKRGPSWCDRILYRTRADYEAYCERKQEEEEAKKRDELMKSRGIEEDENVIFDYDPEEDADDQYDPDMPSIEKVKTRDGQHNEILLEYYTSHQRVLSSDHKPLEAIFSLTYRSVVPEKKSAIHAEVARELDRRENEGRPIVTIVIDKPAIVSSEPEERSAGQVVDIGIVRFKRESHVNATIANTGQVPATLTLVDRPVAGLGEEGPTPPWLTVKFNRDPDPKDKKNKGPATYTLEPGDTCHVEFTAFVEDAELADNLDDEVVKLDEVLILRVQNGRDHFLPVQGKWQKSSLDRSMDKIKHWPEQSIRKLQQQKPAGSAKAGLLAALRGSES